MWKKIKVLKVLNIRIHAPKTHHFIKLENITNKQNQRSKSEQS